MVFKPGMVAVQLPGVSPVPVGYDIIQLLLPPPEPPPLEEEEEVLAELLI